MVPSRNRHQVIDVSQRVTYIYDTNTLDTKQTFSNYTSGRLAAVTYGPESNLNTNPYSIILPTFAEWYNYTQAGLVATKRLQLQQTATVQWPSTKNVALTPLNFDAAYTYDSGGEGKIASVAYPAGGPTYSYQFDSLYRLSGMTDQNSNTDVSGVAYNPANQLTSITYFGVAESRSYNSLNQLTGVSATEGYTRFINKSYTYPTGTNIGKISSQTDSISGEVVNYTYDSLNRLATAATANTAWGQSYTYDAFGNLTGESVTQGSAPSMTLAGSSATNQYGGGYDLNGNMTTSGATTMTYDVANRMIISATSTGSAHFSYDTRNRRVWQWNGAVDQNNNPVSYSIYYYGANGKRLVAYTVTLSQVLTNGHISGYNLNSSVVLQDTYFGRRRLAPMDRIGSAADVGTYPGQQSISFFPYGQDKGTAGANDNWKFATYWRDSATGLDYAMNRYYSSALGRFMSVDPYWGSARSGNPQSLNRYSYLANDPINGADPSGLCNTGIGGITNAAFNAPAFAAFNANGITVFPYSSGSETWVGVPMGILQVAVQAFGAYSSTLAAIQGLLASAAQGGPIDVITFSGGAGAFTAAVNWLNNNGGSNIVSRINNITYVSPGASGTLYTNGNAIILAGNSLVDYLAQSFTDPGGSSLAALASGGGIPVSRANQCGHDFGCIVGAFASVVSGRQSSPCPDPVTINQPVPFYPKSSLLNLFGSGSSPFAFGTWWDQGSGSDDTDDEELTPTVTSTISFILP